MKHRIKPLYYKSFSDYQESIDGRSVWFDKLKIGEKK